MFGFRHHRLAHRQLVLRVIVFNNKLFIYVLLRGGARAPGAISKLWYKWSKDHVHEAQVLIISDSDLNNI